MSLSILHDRLTKNLGRPLLMSVTGAERLAQMITDAEPSAFDRPGRLDAWRKARSKTASHEDLAELEMLPPGGAAYAPMWLGEPDDELEWGMAIKDGIATLCINTAIDAQGEYWCGAWYHGYDTISAAIQQALDDPRVEGIFIHMDSPGGVVHDGIFQLTELIRENRASAGGKSIHVHAELMASAAYWIGSQCDRLTASRTGMVGSIGAVMLHTDVSGALDKAGIKVTPVQGGERKTEFANFKPLDDEAKANLQAMIDQAYSDFVGEVVAGRPSLSAGDLYATEARLYDARNDQSDHSAMAHGLIDAIESEAAAYQALLDEISPDTPAAGLTPTNATQSSVQIMETDMSAQQQALAALSGDGKAQDRIAAAIALLPKGSTARGILLGDGPMKARIQRAKAAIASAISAKDTEEDVEDEDPDKEVEDEDAEDEDPDKDAEDEDPDEDAEDEDPDKDAEDEDPDEDAEDEDDMARAKAILALPEAKGRSALAQELAFEKGITVARAKTLLGKAVRSKARATVTDPDISTNGSGKTEGSADDLATKVLASAKAAHIL